MATQTEKLPQDLIDNIVNSQEEANKIIFELGQTSLRIRNVELELNLLKDTKKQMEDKFDNLNLNLENTLSDLRTKYPNGEIDLTDGVIIFETAE